MAVNVINIGNNSKTPLGKPTEMDNALEVYYGQVLLAFERKNIFLDLVTTKTLQHGSSTSIPVIGRGKESDVKTHVPGTDLTMAQIPVKERVINIDALEYFALAVDKFEEKILHFETRGELAKQAGEALSVKIDKKVAETILLASQTSGVIGGEVLQADGGEINNDVIATGTSPKAKGNALIEAVFAGVAMMEEKNVTGEIVLVVSPITYSYLAQSDGVSKDITSGDNGGINKGTIMEVAGIKIHKSNHLPTTAVAVGATNKKLQGLLFTAECMAVVKMMDLTSETNYLPLQLATLMTTYYSYGMGVLKPACAIAITGGNA